MLAAVEEQFLTLARRLMNFLAHAHLAHLTATSITGNLLGDFVKGNVKDNIKGNANEALPRAWLIGIKLHRKIDIFTDSHPQVTALKTEQGTLRRYSGIILDILFDHIIAKNFGQLSELTLSDFSKLVYQDIARDAPLQPPQFRLVAQRMSDHNWLCNYQSLDTIGLALTRTSQRLSNQPDFLPALDWYRHDSDRIDQQVLVFYQQLIDYSHQQAALLR